MQNHYNNLIKENFFVLDSNNLEEIKSHMYGFSISKNGILTDNYYQKEGKYEEPCPQGVFIMIRKNGKELIINQDYSGSYGIYIYENKNENYFALSNSFLLLQEYLIGKYNLTLNKEFSDSLIVTSLFSYSLEETLITEIKQIPSNAFLIINTEKKEYKINYINYDENSIPLESEEGLKIIDNWIDKWGFIFRSLKKQTDNIVADLSGGFDTRSMISILINSGIDLNEIYINSINDKKHDHDIDFKIASNISSKFGFKLNNYHLDNNGTKWNFKDTLYKIIYSKLGFHKEFYMENIFYSKPRFHLTGGGGECLRGKPNIPIKKLIKFMGFRNILGHEEEFYRSSEKIFKKSISFLNREKTFNNDYEVSMALFCKAVGRNHFGKAALEKFLLNTYTLQPLMDPDIRKIKFDVNNMTSHNLIAYIYVRFSHELIYFPFQGNRILELESIKKAERLNHNFKPYKRKLGYNKNFYIDNQRTSPVNSSKDKINIYDYLNKIFKSSKYIDIINKIYDNNVYNWANKYTFITNHHPLTHHYALFAIAVTLEKLSLNERKMKDFVKDTYNNESNFRNSLIS